MLELDDAFTKQVAESTDGGDFGRINFDIAIAERIAFNGMNSRRAVRIDVDH